MDCTGSAGLKYFLCHPTCDVLDGGSREAPGLVFAYRLAEQAWHQRGSWDVFLIRPLSQLRVQVPVDAQVQRHIQRARLLADLGLDGLAQQVSTTTRSSTLQQFERLLADTLVTLLLPNDPPE